MLYDYADVTRVLDTYLNGLYNGDTHLLSEVFDPGARLTTAADGSLAAIGVSDWLAIVKERESSAARREARLDKIVSIEFGSATTAIARVQCAIGPKLFTDFLSLVRIADSWKIVSKVYQFELLK